MKSKVLVILLTFYSAFNQMVQAEDKVFFQCATESKGDTSFKKSTNLSLAVILTLDNCTASWRADRRECSEKLHCEQTPDSRPSPPEHNGYICKTNSRGITFRAENQNLAVTQNTVVQSCIQDQRTYWEDCRLNIACISKGYRAPTEVYGNLFKAEEKELIFFQNYCRYSFQNSKLVNVALLGQGSRSLNWKCQDQVTGQVFPVNMAESCRLYNGVPSATCSSYESEYCWQCALPNTF